jgi:hypothetical protein
MKLYLVWWNNNHSWDDEEIDLVGAFSTPEIANIEGKKYTDNLILMNDWNEKSFYYIEEWVLDNPISHVLLSTTAQKEPYIEDI